MRDWTLVFDIPDGHRVFLGDDGNYYICDRSGDTPDLADDGPLVISGNIELSCSPGHPILARLRVYSDRDRKNSFVRLDTRYVAALAKAIESSGIKVIGPSWMRALCGVIVSEV